MGNADACCSGAQEMRSCCKSSGKKPDTGGAPVSRPAPSCELMGIEPQPPPGINTSITLSPGSPGISQGFVSRDSANKSDDCGDASSNSQKIVDDDGSTYVGDIDNGMRHGYGVRKSPSGEYVGQWKADAQHGRGSRKWNDGRRYVGEFEHGKFSGQGRMVWTTQKGILVYEGQYRDDLKDGYGKFLWPDGRTYEGEWCCGKRHGRGQHTNARLEKKVGYWVDDKFSRWETDCTDVNTTSLVK